MKRSFQKDIADPDRFVVTLELVPGSEYRGLALDTVKRIARDAMEDGRVSAVTITDNPGGNPSLSPDVIGKEILDAGMDVMVHFTCRDLNRGGIESRALQLALMGIRNILALTGDYAGRGFGGQAMPVFDIESTTLVCFLKTLGDRSSQEQWPEEKFFPGCAVSPFKSTEAETFAQYYKLCKKIGAGADFIITQVGYDARKFHELMKIQKEFGASRPTLGSVYVLKPGAAKIMARGKIPGAVVVPKLLREVLNEWKDKKRGEELSVERAARLSAVLKGLGYRGIHVGGVHKSFSDLARILDRMEEIQDRWMDFVPDFDYPQENGFYVHEKDSETGLCSNAKTPLKSVAKPREKAFYLFMSKTHDIFFNKESFMEPAMRKFCSKIDGTAHGRLFTLLTEDVSKEILFSCIRCGDCGIQHLAFLCPESQCPKHMRNGACGGSREGMCEVFPDRPCVWVRVYKRLASVKATFRMAGEFVPPRLWELNKTSSWINFHLGRDHQTASCSIARLCGADRACPFQPKIPSCD